MLTARRTVAAPLQGAAGLDSPTVDSATVDERRSPTWIQVAAFLLIGSCLYLMRPLNAAERFTFGSEDATVFVNQPRQLGILRSFYTTYSGYYHLLPRAVGALTSILPLQWAPVLTFCAAGFFAVIAAGLAYYSSRGLKLSAISSLLISGTVLLLPASGYEVVGNLPNVEWYCFASLTVFVAALLAGYQPPVGRTVLLLLLAGLTTPLTVIALPFVAIAVLRRRSSINVLVSATMAVTVAVQVIGRLTSPSQQGSISVGAHQIYRLFTVRIGAGAFLGDRLLHLYYNTLGGPLSEAVGLVVVIVVLIIGVTQRQDDRWPCFFLLTSSLVILVTAIAERSQWFDIQNIGLVGGTVLFDGRYMGVPALCLVLVVVIAGDRLWFRAKRKITKQMLGASLAVMALLLVANIPVNLYRPTRQSFDSAVAQARKNCSVNHDQGVINISTGPFASAQGGFRVVLTCHQAFG
jgi:hypothetical protein